MSLLLTILLTNLAPDAIPAEMLAPAILEVSNKYKVDPVLVCRIIIIESRGRAHVANKRTQDYGLMQLNINTMAAMGISHKCAMDWRCNLEQGVLILSKFRRTCRYNVGTGKLEGARMQRCIKYERKLASVE